MGGQHHPLLQPRRLLPQAAGQVLRQLLEVAATIQRWLLQPRHVHVLPLGQGRRCLSCRHLVGVCLAVLTLHARHRRAVLQAEGGSTL